MIASYTHFPRPTYGPRRDHSYLTEEPEITRISRALGKEPQPWQRYAWAVGTEYRLDSRGRRHYHYTDVLVSVPRQSGKTTMLHPLRVTRMINNDRGRLFSTAQTQKHSSKRMLDMLAVLEASTLAPLFKTRHGKGDAGARCVENGADISQFTPNEEATHGETPNYVDLDEIWFYSLELGNAIVASGIRPAMVTLADRGQRWYTSTMGTLASEFMNEMVKKGRDNADPRLCYIEYSLPEGLDPYDPASWWMFHPALGNTIGEDALKADLDLPEAQWLRGYCNRLTDVSDTFMPLENWDDLVARERLVPPADSVTVAFEVSPGNENAAVVAGWYAGDTPHVHVLHQAPGTIWVIPYLRDLARQGFTHFAADDGGPVRRLLDRLPDEIPAQRLTYSERYLADQTLITAARDDATLQHDGSTPLRLAVASAQIRKRNGMELIDREKSLNPVPSLIAASVALYANRHPLEAAPAPLIVG